MSLNYKNILIAGTGVLVGASVILGGTKLGTTKAENPPIKKWSVAKVQGLKKMSRAAEIEIENLDRTLPEFSDQAVSLRGHIKLENQLSGEMSYKWILPEGVEVVEGSVSGSLGQTSAGQTITVDIRVTGLSVSDQPRTVVLQAHGRQNGIKMGGAASFSSHPVDQEARTTASEKMSTLSEDPEDDISAQKRTLLKGISQ